MKKKMDKKTENRGKRGTVRKQMETILRQHGTDRSTYHGGELTGVKIMFCTVTRQYVVTSLSAL